MAEVTRESHLILQRDPWVVNFSGLLILSDTTKNCSITLGLPSRVGRKDSPKDYPVVFVMEMGWQLPSLSGLHSFLLSSSYLYLPLASDILCKQQGRPPLQSLQWLIHIHCWQESFPGHCRAKLILPSGCHWKTLFSALHCAPHLLLSPSSRSCSALTAVHTYQQLNILGGRTGSLYCVLHFSEFLLAVCGKHFPTTPLQSFF